VSVRHKNKLGGLAFALRARLSEAQNHRCAYCGVRMEQPTIDHVRPLSKGGALGWENAVAACLPCNQMKGNTRHYPYRRSWKWNGMPPGTPRPKSPCPTHTLKARRATARHPSS